MCELQYTWRGSGVKRLCYLPPCFPARHPNQASLDHDDVSTEHRQAEQACHDCLLYRNRAPVIPGMGKGWLSPLTILEPMLK